MRLGGRLLLIWIFAVCAFGTTAWADVIGSFETHILLVPQTTLSEIELADFDFQNDLTMTVVLSGLSTTFHTHFGIAGVEDIVVTSNASIGFLNITTTLAFGRFQAFQVTPFYPSLHFLLKEVEATFNFGGINLTNTSQIQDINAFINQTGAYAFGDSFRIQGQTPSGVGVVAEAGICMTQQSTAIKKHFGLSRFRVNADCFTTPKPDLLFDFENVSISNIPIAPNLTGSIRINCIQNNPCGLVQTISFAGDPIPFIAGLTFTDLLNVSFNGANITLLGENATLVIAISPVGTLSFATVTVNSDFSPDPLSVRLTATFVPGAGLTSANLTINVQPANGLGFGANVTFGGGPPAELQTVRVSMAAPGQLIDFRLLAQFRPDALDFAEMFITFNF